MRMYMLISAFAFCSALASGTALAQATGSTGTAITPQISGVPAGIAPRASAQTTQPGSQRQQGTSQQATPQSGHTMSNGTLSGGDTGNTNSIGTYSNGRGRTTTLRANSTTNTGSGSSSGH
ncbi:hypothetical protein DWU98_16870 [Dyella monticola]|uniref:Uncharacterized protein n=1 Tax=Dyella monticola TaxID=1927958 RepID=A0A370WUQ1_9GAMM|nr:hypothetical protein [Dyella monticola]RDS79737.1 hypothetical protein DWU98_16870 [Dyella monticola]